MGGCGAGGGGPTEEGPGGYVGGSVWSWRGGRVWGGIEGQSAVAAPAPHDCHRPPVVHSGPPMCSGPVPPSEWLRGGGGAIVRTLSGQVCGAPRAGEGGGHCGGPRGLGGQWRGRGGGGPAEAHRQSRGAARTPPPPAPVGPGLRNGTRGGRGPRRPSHTRTSVHSTGRVGGGGGRLVWHVALNVPDGKSPWDGVRGSA